MSKKASLKIRKRWKINPKTKIKKSKKLYSRAGKKREDFKIEDESGR